MNENLKNREPKRKGQLAALANFNKYPRLPAARAPLLTFQKRVRADPFRNEPDDPRLGGRVEGNSTVDIGRRILLDTSGRLGSATRLAPNFFKRVNFFNPQNCNENHVWEENQFRARQNVWRDFRNRNANYRYRPPSNSASPRNNGDV